MLEIQFPATQTAPQPADIIAVYNGLDIQDPQVQSSDQGVLVIRSKEIPEETKTLVVNEINTKFNTEVTILRFDTVGPSIGKEVATRAAGAVGAAALAILIYITFAFPRCSACFSFWNSRHHRHAA